MVERRRELRLVQEALAEVGLPDRRRQQLDSRRAPQPHMLGPIDDARRAVSDRLDDPVATDFGLD